MDKELEHSKLDDTQSIQTQDEENIKQVLVVERIVGQDKSNMRQTRLNLFDNSQINVSQMQICESYLPGDQNEDRMPSCKDSFWNTNYINMKRNNVNKPFKIPKQISNKNDISQKIFSIK